MKFDKDDIKRRLLVKYPSFGSILANLKIIEDKTCYDYNGNMTIAIDGEAIYYHPDFMNSVNVSQQVALFAHEIGHVALDHIYRSDGRDQETWNYATDAVINANLKHDGLELVPGMIEIEDAINYDAETLYNKLLQDKKESQENINGSNNSSGDNNNETKQSPPGSHKKWKEAIAKRKQENKEKNASQDMENKPRKEISEKDFFKKNRILKKELLKDLKQDCIKRSYSGDETNSNIRNINDIGKSNHLINWKNLLRSVTSFYMDWSFKHATIEYGVITPHLENIKIPLTEILLDTSGSIDETLLRNFLKECKSILKESRIKVGCFDTKFYGFEEVRNEQEIDNLELIGGGGTDFNVCMKAFSRNAENKIIFTDGRAKMPDEKMNVIWIVFGDRKINPKGGKVIYINDEQLKELYYYQASNELKGKTR